MAPECQMFHSRLAELIAIKKAEEYSKTMNWLRVKISFSVIRSALVCLRGSRCLRRRPYSELNEVDIDIQTIEGRTGQVCFLFFLSFCFFFFSEADIFQ